VIEQRGRTQWPRKARDRKKTEKKLVKKAVKKLIKKAKKEAKNEKKALDAEIVDEEVENTDL
jgi:uncharacterized protein GlcG (DUF336 family)